MNDLSDLLDRAAGPADPAHDTRADLLRGQRALARTRRRRTALGAAGVVAAGAVGLAAAGLGTGGRGSTPVATDPSTVAPTVEATPATPPPTTAPISPTAGPTSSPRVGIVTTTPRGWQVQGDSPSTLVMARPGDTTSRDDFAGKLVMMLTSNPPSGERREDGTGRAVWVDASGESGYSTVAVRTRQPEEPRGVLVMQFPTDAIGLDRAIRVVTDALVLRDAVPVGG
jgi:hypothetical protein